MSDILQDIAERAEEAGIDMQVMRRVLAEVRRDWGGENAYIPKRGEKPHVYVMRRAAEARALWQRGERIPAIARRMGVSPKYVYKLLKKSPPSLNQETRNVI